MDFKSIIGQVFHAYGRLCRALLYVPRGVNLDLTLWVNHDRMMCVG